MGSAGVAHGQSALYRGLGETRGVPGWGQILGKPFTRARRLVFYMRLPFIIFPLLIVFLVWHWGRQLFAEWIALTLAACMALEPTLLGHGALNASDVPSAFAALWVAYSAWRYWRHPDLRRLLLLTVALIVAVLTKFTLMPLAVLVYGLALWRGPRLVAAFGIPLALYASILAASQFQAQPVAQDAIDRFQIAGVPDAAMPIARTIALLPWPRQFIEGLIFVGTSVKEDHFAGYMLGRVIHGWAPGYFPLCWALKFPIPLQILTMAGWGALAVRLAKREWGTADALIWGGAAFIFGAAIFSNYHIGFRHVLPALPFFVLSGGFALQRWGHGRPAQVVIRVCLAWLAVSSLRMFPQEVSYFNEWIGNPVKGWKYLADSNMDWGQNLPELGKYIARNHVEELHTVLFTSDSPWHYIRGGILSPIAWPPEDAPPAAPYRPGPGLYAISVNALVGVVAPPGQEQYFAAFRPLSIKARAGYSIFIYEVK